MIAAKAFDPVVGIDIHIIQPPGPVPPVPVPHPFIGILLDPFDFAPIIGSTVSVNGLPRATAGTGGRCLPPHIPIGGVFVKPPANECDVFMGSSTVLADDEPLSFLGMPALSCHCIGIPPIPRLKKKRRVKSLVLPTTFVIAIPMGAPVLVGGPPTISMMALGMRAAMAGLGKAFKKLRKLQKASRRMKALSDKIQNAAKKAMNKLGVPPSVQNRVSRAICSVTGHPVDVATGKVFTESVDWQLPGAIRFRWERVWYSCSIYDGPLGRGWHHSYDIALSQDIAEGVVAVRWADGRPVVFPALPEEGSEVLDRGERITLFRDGEGYGLRGPEGRLYRFLPPREPGAEQPLASVADGTGHAITFTYDGDSRLTVIEDSAGRRLRVHSDAAGRIIALSAPHPDRPTEIATVVSYRYDAGGHLVEAEDALGGVVRYVYSDGLLVRETLRNGLSFYFDYDSSGPSARCIRTWGDGGVFDHKLAYDLDSTETAVENSLGQVTRYQWNASGVVTGIVDALGATSAIDYNEHNQVVAEVDAEGARFSYDYDDRGNLTSVARPDGTSIAIAYEQDRPVQAIDTLGHLWLWNYDAAGRIVRSVDPLGGTTVRRYDRNTVVELRHEGAATVVRTYDQAANLVTLETPGGGSTRWSYDALGRPTERIDPNGALQRRWFDLMARVVRIEETDGTTRTYEHDQDGRIVRARDPDRDVRFSYSPTGRLTRKEEAGTHVVFEYDTEDQLTAVTNEHGLTYRFGLDANGRVISEAGFDGRPLRFRRDALGRVTRIDRPAGRFTEYTYDALDRVTEVRYADGEIHRYRWRADGQMMRAENSSVAVVFERDALGRIVKEHQGKNWVASEYDADGNRIRVSSSLGLSQIIERDAIGDPRSLRVTSGSQVPWGVSFDYIEPGREHERVLPGGLHVRRRFDAAGRLTSQEVSKGREQLYSQLLTWASGPHVVAIHHNGRGATRYSHAGRGFLAGAEYPDGTVEVRLPDAAGNVFRTQTRRDRKYGAAGELLIAAGARYHYDEEGNLVRRLDADGSEWLYHWNGAGRLTTVRRPDGQVVCFSYDALGRRLTKTIGGRTTVWVWDGHRPLHEVTRSSRVTRSASPAAATDGGADIRPRSATAFLLAAPSTGPPQEEPPGRTLTWIFEPHSLAPLAKIVDGKQWFSIVTNHLGTPTAMFDEAGHQVWDAELDLLGGVRNATHSATMCPFRFPGQYEDEETGLYYNRFRYYDPVGGVYISQDPTRLRGGLGLYAYVRDVLTALDPFGLLTLYHYTTEEGMEGITSSESLHPSIGDKNARFGSGQYFTDIPPENIGAPSAKDLTDADKAAGKISQGKAAANIYGDARKYRSLDYFVEIDVTGLDVENPRPGTYLIRGDTPLDVKGRIVRAGKTCGT
jgi:RHS repeat-associated protein